MKREIIKLVAYSHNAFDIRIFHREARALADAGNTVKIIVPHTRSETVNGIEFIAVPFPQTKFQKIFYSSLRTLRFALRESRKAVFHVHDHKLLVVGYVLRMLGRKVVYDGHEDLPLHIGYQHWIPVLVKPFYKAFFMTLEWWSGWIMSGVIVSEPLIARHFPKGRAQPIQTFPVKRDFEAAVEKIKTPSILYIGQLSEPRGIRNVIETLDLVNAQMQFEFHFAGMTSPPDLLEDLKAKPYLRYHGFLSQAETYKLMMAGHVAIYLPTRIRRYEINHPVKLYEFFAAGLPLITYDFGYTGKLVNDLKAGITVPYNNNAEAAAALMRVLRDDQLRDTLSTSARSQVFERFNWENEIPGLLAFYDRIS